MSVVLPPLQPYPMVGDQYRRDLMIEYAYKTYKYVITAEEVEEIMYEGLWEDVDMYCEYMMDANFGESIPDTNNVKLPSTMRIYTSAELDAMDAGFTIDDEPPIRVLTDEEVDAMADAYLRPSSLGVGIESNEESELRYITAYDDSDLDDDEPLPLYNPDKLPRYSTLSYADHPPSTPPSIYEVEEVVRDEPATPPYPVDLPSDAPPSMNEVEAEDVVGETEVVDVPEKRSLGSRLDRKIRKAKQKLSRGLEHISLKRALERAVASRWKKFPLR
ncbi:hypothetical protein F5B20DRAFT_576372 [Whalleya microplaca]|nr:hypothetical protein F5B20DRAFT_576372 [Whalleya microplaca]